MKRPHTLDTYMYMYLCTYVHIFSWWVGGCFIFSCMFCVRGVGGMSPCIYVYVYVLYIYIYIYRHTYIYLYIFVFIYTYICVCVCVYALCVGGVLSYLYNIYVVCGRVGVCVAIYVFIHMCVCLSMCVCVSVCVYICWSNVFSVIYALFFFCYIVIII